NPARRAPVPDNVVALFFHQLKALLLAGFTVGGALADLGPRTANVRLREACARMASATTSGAGFADALANEPGLFPPGTTGLVAAGEAGGFLPEACAEIALSAEQALAIRRGMWWVSLLIWQSVWSVLLFQPIFGSLDFEQPMRTLANYVHALLVRVLPIGVALHGVTFAAGWWMRTEAGAPLRERAVELVPVLRRWERARALSSFTRVLRRLLRSGISPATAYRGACAAVANDRLRARFLAGAEILDRAGGIDGALGATGLLPHDPLQLLVTGQRTGTWDDALDKVAARFEDEAAESLEAVRRARKRFGILLTLVTTGYITIAGTDGAFRTAFRFADHLLEP
ncbi:MAG: type II secretion system F family protein, partial [Armatimonadota bacterium]